jgi:hypothetical protein
MTPIRIRHPELSSWLIRFSELLNRSQFERAAFLCRNKRVWDYHASAGAAHASVEDTHNTFFEAEVRWKNTNNPSGSVLHLPDPSKDLDFSCSCGREMPCAHVSAVVLYRILEWDSQLRSARRTQPAALPDQDDATFRMLLKKLGQMAEGLPPAVARFDPSALKTRPDLQPKMEVLSKQVIRSLSKTRDSGKS